MSQTPAQTEAVFPRRWSEHLIKRDAQWPAKLTPDFHTNATRVDVVYVWVRQQAARVGNRKPEPFHRVMGECPICGAQMSAGRLTQHAFRVHMPVLKLWAQYQRLHQEDTGEEPNLDTRIEMLHDAIQNAVVIEVDRG